VPARDSSRLNDVLSMRPSFRPAGWFRECGGCFPSFRHQQPPPEVDGTSRWRGCTHRACQPFTHLVSSSCGTCEEAVDGLWRVSGMKRRKYQMTGFAGVKHNLRGFAVANFTDKMILGACRMAAACRLETCKIKPSSRWLNVDLIGVNTIRSDPPA